MPWTSEAERNEPQIDDEGPGVRRWPAAAPKVFKSLRMIHAEALAIEKARERKEVHDGRTARSNP